MATDRAEKGMQVEITSAQPLRPLTLEEAALVAELIGDGSPIFIPMRHAEAVASLRKLLGVNAPPKEE